MKRFVCGARAELCVEDTQTARPGVVCPRTGVCDPRMRAPQVAAFNPAVAEFLAALR